MFIDKDLDDVESLCDVVSQSYGLKKDGYVLESMAAGSYNPGTRHYDFRYVVLHKIGDSYRSSKDVPVTGYCGSYKGLKDSLMKSMTSGKLENSVQTKKKRGD